MQDLDVFKNHDETANFSYFLVNGVFRCDLFADPEYE